MRIETAITTARSMSRIVLGRGTMIIAKIAITKTTILRSRDANIADKTVLTLGAFRFAFAKRYSSKIASSVSRPKKASTFPCKRFKNGHKPQVVA